VTGWTSRKRFWTEAAVTALDDGWGVTLDGRPLRTPARALLTAPTRAAAEACAAEWSAQPETYDPATMPVTRALNSAVDRVAPQFAAVAAEVAAYGGTDLLCYRAPAPQELADRQAEAWDPWLDWARTRHGAPLVCVAGVIHTPQPPESLSRLAAAVAPLDSWRLTALHELTALSGSLILGLAVEEGALDAEKAWKISRLDEDWQIAQWGEDAEAAETAARKAADFAAAARLAALLR
jgi:chaperone required for assembly of F1-ATPase